MKKQQVKLNMRFFILTILTLMAFKMVKAQSPLYDWTAETDGAQNEETRGIAVDNNNNTYILGEINSVGNSFSLNGAVISETNGKIFLCKIDPAGNVLWTLSTGIGPVEVDFSTLSVDSDGNVYFTGTLGGSGTSTVIGNTTIVNTSPSNWYHSFLAKFDTNGAFQWAYHFDGNLPEPGFASSAVIPRLALDQTDNIIVTISFTGLSMTVDGVTYTQTNPSQSDIVMVKLNPVGAVVWSKHITGNGDTSPRGISVDTNNNIYLCGQFYNPTTFDPSWIISPSSTNTNSVFLAKYNSAGVVQWAKRSNTQGTADFADLDIYDNDHIAIVGVANNLVLDTIDFTSLGTNGIAFLGIFDTNGTALSAKTFLSPISNSGVTTNKVSFDNTGNIFIAGTFFTDIDLEGTTYFNSGAANTKDVFLIKYDLSGNHLWNTTYGSNINVNWADIASRPDGNTMVSGYYNGNSINIGTGSFTNTGQITSTIGYYDFFVTSIGGDNFIKWTGNNSSSWTSPFNWEPQQVPTANDNVKIPAGRPFEPIIKSGEVANCKKLTIDNGALFRMNAGILNVYGPITATSAGAFQLNGGGIHLFHGSEFPQNMTFNNLTIKNENDVDADNIYKFNGFNEVKGNFKVFGTATKPTLPKIILEEGDDFHVRKNFVLSAGTFGWPYSTSIPSDRSQLPGLFFSGTGVQNITISNQSSVQNSSVVDCNIYMANPAAKFTLPNRELAFFNLIVNDNFNLAGKRLNITGKIVYANGIGSTFKITNSNPSRGSISIFNDAILVYDADDQYIRMDKVRTLRCNLSSPLTNTILQTAFAADTLEVKGYLDLNGQNLTIGSTSTNLGTLEVDSLGTSISQGTLFLYGDAVNSPYQLVAKALNNLVLNSPNGVVLNNAINIPSTSLSWSQMLLYGTAKLTTGTFDLNGSLISLVKNTNTNSPNVAKIVETPFNTFLNLTGTGAGSGLRIDTNVTTAISNKNYGGLGFIIQSDMPLNQLSIIRSPVQQTGLNGGSSVFRTYTVSNQGSSPGMNAFVSIKYDDIELGGVNESDLGIYRRSSNDPAGVWNFVGSIVNTTSNIVESFVALPSIDYSTSVGGFTQYTLASNSNPPRIAIESLSNSIKWNVYPNPFTSELSAQFNSEISESASLRVFDFAGKLIDQKSVQLNKGINNINLCCLDELPGGVYFLKITSSQTNSVVKVVKQ